MSRNSTRPPIHQIRVENPVGAKLLNASKIRSLIKWILINEKTKGFWTINVILADDAFISQMNRSYFALDEPTDVISFNLSDTVDDSREGEIYVSVERAKLQAQEYAVSLENEILRLVAHGTYHLLDYDDQTDAEKQRMSQLEDQAIAAVSISR
jgi:probable rRNA maturation factor